jgi:hypothetical protein
MRRRGWAENGAGWRDQLAQELGLTVLTPDWTAFTRVRPEIHDPRLVIEAPSLRDRRDIYMCIKAAQSPVRAHMHLTPQCKATKTFIYFTARRQPVRIEDWGDIVSLYWLSNQAKSVRVDIGRSAAEVEAQLNTFLEDRPQGPSQ